ncbi:M17 family metallopeptidase, partial [Candidatus Riflebacteria bacterium]
TLTPAIFAETIKKQVRGLKNLSIKVLHKSDIEKLGMGALLAVARGSDNPPKVLVLRYNGAGKKSPKIGLVGKGVTFDTGGYDLKPSSGIYRMYGDMAGAASVCATMIAAAKLGLKQNIVAIAGLVENRVNGKAYLPGDILESMSGKTIEVLNTDAEGRLVLADCLTYIQRKEKVDEVIDLATLTGAMVICLGHFVTGAFANNDSMFKKLYAAGERSHERLWRLPLYSDYFAQIKSDVADLENVGGRAAGSITAAMFLAQFIEKDLPWIHLDIAGTSFMEESIFPYAKKPYYPKEGATGLGPRLLLHYLASLK